MARKQRRQFTAEQKLRILEEARQPNTTVAEVLRRHGVDAATLGLPRFGGHFTNPVMFGVEVFNDQIEAASYTTGTSSVHERVQGRSGPVDARAAGAGRAADTD